MQNRRWGLDLLRAIAILVVVEQHGRYISEKIGNKLQFIGLTDGVDLFFVLSGFLIGAILIKDYSENESLNIKRFWIRRWLRTLPIYLVALLLNIFFMLFIFKYDFDLTDMFLHFGFIQNMIPPYTDYRFFSEAWSLSIEEFFYLGLPLTIAVAIYFTKKQNESYIFLRALSFLVLFSFCFRAFLYHRLPAESFSLTEWNTRFRVIIPERLDSLAIGVFAALIRFKYSILWHSKSFRWISFIIGLLIVICLDRTWIFNNTIPLGFFAFVPYFLIYSIGVAFTLPLLDSFQPKENLFTKSVSQVSKLSYSMYLFHNSLLVIPMKNYSHTLTNEYLKVGLYLLYWVLVFLISYVGYTLIEKPVLKYRDKIYA